MGECGEREGGEEDVGGGERRKREEEGERGGEREEGGREGERAAYHGEAPGNKLTTDSFLIPTHTLKTVLAVYFPSDSYVSRAVVWRGKGDAFSVYGTRVP